MQRCLAPILAVTLPAMALSGWAGQIKWTAAGTVESVQGGGFTPLASVDDPVQIEFSYDDRANRVPVSGVNGIWNHVEFRDGVNLDLKVTIGANTWHGTLDSGTPGGTRTIELIDFQIGGVAGNPTYDEFMVRLAAPDGATFPEFPGTPPGPQHLMAVRFRDGSETAAAPDYVGSEDLACAAHSISRITVADGEIGTGIERIGFTIDPNTIETEIAGARPLELREISFADGLVTMKWPTEPGRFYLIQYLDDFLCWREVISVLADGAEVTETFFPFGITSTQLYRVVELE